MTQLRPPPGAAGTETAIGLSEAPRKPRSRGGDRGRAARRRRRRADAIIRQIGREVGMTPAQVKRIVESEHRLHDLRCELVIRRWRMCWRYATHPDDGGMYR